MKKTALTVMALGMLYLVQPAAYAQKPDVDFFDDRQMIIGAYYYPEHWNPEHWERDLKKMSELGFTFTHFGEFAWSMMEPEEGRFDFDWLDRAIEIAARYKLKIIMCTPTPTPPAWLTYKHPEILTVDEQGIKQRHGSRLHVSYNHPVYLHYTEKIVTQLAKRYGQDDRIWGWQVDNEPHYGVLYDYSEQHQKAFRTWLASKYNTIDDLNAAWGNAFWSQTYNNFYQIRIPNASEAPQGANPHALLDFQRFNADELASALRFQTEILKKHIKASQWITTNYAYYKFLPSVDLFRNQNDFHFASHTMYLTSQFLNDSGDSLAHRLSSGMELSFSAEFARSINGYTGIMELQPGQINWGKINPQPLPGAVRMWVWHSYALGDQFACTYRFRQPLFGSEFYHKGILEPDGTTLSAGGAEYAQVIREIGDLPIPNKIRLPKSLKSRNTAFLWNQDNLWDLENYRHHEDWDTWQYFYTYYESLKSMGARVTFIQEKDSFDPEVYPFMVAPAFQLSDDSLIDKWEEYVKKGGNLILTCRTAQKDRNGKLPETLLQQSIYGLIGGEIEFFDHLPAAWPGKVDHNDKSYRWHIWGDVIKPAEQTRVLAKYADQFYKGKAAVTQRKLGKGSVTYIGAWSHKGELEKAILSEVYQNNKAEILQLPPYVFVEWRNGYWIAVNYSSVIVEIPVTKGANIIYGNPVLAPGQVLVWSSE
ncbi:MAG: beta-galactosidase [Cyclobacteriaceae bacterium]|nr:beta-galactosidase [Cyclobacteriaceae bacterium]